MVLLQVLDQRQEVARFVPAAFGVVKAEKMHYVFVLLFDGFKHHFFETRCGHDELRRATAKKFPSVPSCQLERDPFALAV